MVSKGELWVLDGTAPRGHTYKLINYIAQSH